jgi:uncharacterized membrane protein YhaH (DUF805 family)
MRIQPSLLWTRNGTIGRVPYLLTGMILIFVKYALDWTIAAIAFGQSWSPLNYLIWPNDRVIRVFQQGDAQQWFLLTMLLTSLPFIWTGVVLTLHRMRAAGLPLWLILLFFVPLVNLLLFLVLVLMPARETSPAPVRMEGMRRLHQSIARDSYWRSGLLALAISVPLAVGATVLGAEMFQSYGFSLFVGAPFALGMISVLVFGFSRPQPLGACLIVATVASFLAGVAVVAVALEGVICLIMAAPIGIGLAFLGAMVGFAIQSRPWLNDHSATLALALMLTLPTLMAAESANEPEPVVRAVQTEVIVNAMPDEIWPHVIAFPPLPEPDDWFFQTGLAYPQRATIHGEGVGAVRHCVFSTGAFVEPIDVWNPPNLLRFRVTEQPEPMQEWSPYHIHPAHLNHYLQSHEGEFRLEALPDGRTRLVGTTRYSNRMWPAAYWHLWSDYIIHRIHGRVLTHIQKLAEASHGETRSYSP